MCYLSVKRSGEQATRFCSRVTINDIANQSVDTSFFTREKNRMTNQLTSLARRDYFYLNAFWRVNLGMYIINIDYSGDYFMLGECVRFLFTSCEGSRKRRSERSERVSLTIFHNE